MNKLKRRGKPRPSHWRSVSDDHLLSVELTTDDPESLPGIVFELPEGDEEPHVEYAYDLLGSDREMFRCVHGNHRHLAGFVMNKGGLRFLVGHICGKKIYGADFERLKKDYDYAKERQDTLRRVREVKAVIHPFLEWVEKVAKAEVFGLYESVKMRLSSQMSWLWEQLESSTNYEGGMLDGIKLPATLFDGFTDPQKEFRVVAAEISKLGLLLIAKTEIEKDVQVTLARMQYLLKRMETALDQVKEVEDFFQPANLGPICDWATESDNPKRRKYEAGLGSISCRRDTGRTEVSLPKNFSLPSREPIAAFRTALAGFG